MSILELRLPAGQRMKFRAGQYLRVRLDDLMRRKLEGPAMLIWGGRRNEGLSLRSAVGRWQAGLPAFRFVLCLKTVSTTRRRCAVASTTACAAWTSPCPDARSMPVVPRA